MIGKILTEINRLKDELDGYSAKEGLDYIESYINTLSKQQEQPSEDLRQMVNHIWKCRGKGDPSRLVLFSYDEVGSLMRTGATWQKQQMLKDAVEGVAEELYNDGEIHCTVGVGTYFKPGDEVYVIKKED